MAPRENISLSECEDASINSTTEHSKQALVSRTVTFAPTAKVRQVAKMTKEEAKDIWFVHEDFAKMKKSFAPTVLRMMDGDLTEEEAKGEEHCTRGLEYRTKDGARRRMKNKFNGISAVLHEQDRQIFEEINDPLVLAAIYRQVSAQCVEEAIALGRYDELDVQEYLAEQEEVIEEAEDIEDSEVVDDATVSESPAAEDASSYSISSRGRSSKKKLRKSSSSSLHERTIKGLRRVLSGGKNRRRNTVAVSA